MWKTPSELPSTSTIATETGGPGMRPAKWTTAEMRSVTSWVVSGTPTAFASRVSGPVAANASARRSAAPMRRQPATPRDARTVPMVSPPLVARGGPARLARPMPSAVCPLRRILRAPSRLKQAPSRQRPRRPFDGRPPTLLRLGDGGLPEEQPDPTVVLRLDREEAVDLPHAVADRLHVLLDLREFVLVPGAAQFGRPRVQLLPAARDLLPLGAQAVVFGLLLRRRLRQVGLLVGEVAEEEIEAAVPVPVGRADLRALAAGRDRGRLAPGDLGLRHQDPCGLEGEGRPAAGPAEQRDLPLAIPHQEVGESVPVPVGDAGPRVSVHLQLRAARLQRDRLRERAVL